MFCYTAKWFLILVFVAGWNCSQLNAFSSTKQIQSLPITLARPSPWPRSVPIIQYRPQRSRSKTVLLGDQKSNSNNENSQSSSNSENVPSAENTTSLSLSSSENDVEAAEIDNSAEAATATDISAVSTTLPSYKKLLLFTGTTILIWISEPLLSLVDTTVVGLTQKNAVVQVAALGPATTLIDSLQYLTYFLAMATTSQVAKFLALKDYRKLQETTSQILGVAAVLGLLISTILFAFGLPILKSMIGASQSPELVGLAAKYCWIRASVAPLAVMGMVAESSCLANVDTKTPAIAVLSASIVNVVGDLALAFMGIQGAAIATAVATATSTAIMMRTVRKRKAVWRKKELREQDDSYVVNGTNLNGSAGFTSVEKGYPTLKDTASNDLTTSPVSEQSSSNNIKGSKTIANQNAQATTNNKEVPFLSLPDKKSLVDLVTVSGPMFYVMLGKIVCYGAMSIRATDFGVVNLAAHSIMMRVFFFFGCFGDSLGQAVQSFLPTALYPKPDAKNIRKMLKRFTIFTTAMALLISQSSNWILTNLASAFTNDKAVIASIAKHAPFVGLALLLHPFILFFESTMIATRDFKQLVSSYTVTMVMHMGLLLLACSSFREIWRVFLLFQGIRLGLFGTRVIRTVARPSQQQSLA